MCYSPRVVQPLMDVFIGTYINIGQYGRDVEFDRS